MSHVVIVGDVLLDRDLIGSAHRLCPDAPVPVVDEELLLERPGGAGLAAALARRHGVDVTLIAAFAADDAGRRLRRTLADADVDVVALDDSGSTSEKLRVRVDGHSLLRLDRGAPGRLGLPPAAAHDAVVHADAIMVADYGRGVTAVDAVRALVGSAAASATPVIWDPHPRGTTPVRHATIVTPNRGEAERFAGPSVHREGRPLATAIAAATQLRDEWAAQMVAVTLGIDGAVAVDGDGPPQVVPVRQPAVGSDACGAGDAFAAAAAVAMASGSSPFAAIATAVAEASRFVADGGAACLAGPPSSPSTIDPGSATPDPVVVDRLDAVRRAGGTVVATGGCFDVLHPGHVSTLERARRLGDHLVVLVNDDASVSRLKGPDRPVQRCEDRVAVLRSLGCVDDVVVFGEDTPVTALRRLRPDIFVKGGDYDSASMPETAVLAEWGGVVVTVPFLDGRSTTRILQGRDAHRHPSPVPSGSGTTKE